MPAPTRTACSFPLPVLLFYRRLAGSLAETEWIASVLATNHRWKVKCRGADWPRHFDALKTSQLATAPTRCAFFGRDDRQQDIRRLAVAQVQRGDAIEDRHRAVDRIIVQERSTTGEFIFEVRLLAAAATAILIILAADREAEVARLVELGAKRVTDMDEWGYQWTVMQDPEGNEFCVAQTR